MTYQTCDLDNVTHEQMHRIVAKILSLPCCQSVSTSPSQLKGYHLFIFCKGDGSCELCRQVFDDQKRYERDARRPVKWRNVLFTSKGEVAHFAKGVRR